jgi:asparagine synthase (glutamine-hydrolysing)
MKTTIAVLDKRGGNATQVVIKALSSLRLENSEGFGVATPSAVAIGKDVDALQNQKIVSPIVVACAFSSLLSYYKKQCMSLEDATLVFDGKIYSPPRASIAEAFAKKLQQADHGKASEALLAEVEGDFSFIIAEPERIIAGRDPVGVQPLYYGENRTVAALASNRKALWKLGIDEVRSFPPGHLAFVSREGFKFKPVKTLVYSEPKLVTMQKAAETLQKLLEQSVRRRVWGTKEVAVAFSGGLDSGVVAFLAKKCQANVHLVHVSLENQPETEEAKKAADELNLPIQVCLFREADVEKVVHRVVELIEEPDPVKASIGVPFYWTAEKTAEAEFKVLLAGQGADELFGGYQRYVNEYLLHGKKKVRKTMFDDVIRLHESNIERDVKICNFHNVDLRLPFGSYQISEFAANLPTELKIERKASSLRTLVLRKVAENMGLPASITEKPKKAVQYATGINNALKKIAKKQKTTVAEYVNKIFLSQMTEN